MSLLARSLRYGSENKAHGEAIVQSSKTEPGTREANIEEVDFGSLLKPAKLATIKLHLQSLTMSIFISGTEVKTFFPSLIDYVQIPVSVSEDIEAKVYDWLSDSRLKNPKNPYRWYMNTIFQIMGRAGVQTELSYTAWLSRSQQHRVYLTD